MKKNITALKVAMSKITKSHKSIVYSVFDSCLVVIYVNFQGKFAQRDAKACSANWWRSINDELKEIPNFYYEVGVTWSDKYGEVKTEKSTSHNFPHKAGCMPHQISFPDIPPPAMRHTG